MLLGFTKTLKLIFKIDVLLPILLLLTYIMFIFIIRGVLPSSDELITSFSTLYEKYGYEILFTAAFLETLVLINLFAPGMIALALGILFARTGHTDLTLVVLVISAGAISGYVIDYILGQYGFLDLFKRFGYQGLLSKATMQLKKFGSKGLIVSFINGNVGSFMSVAAGVAGIGWIEFLATAVFSTIVWVSLWSILIYALGDLFLIVIRKYFILLMVVFVGVLFLSAVWGKESKSKVKNQNSKLQVKT